MTSLRNKMAEHGFESNESYDYIVKCLQSLPGPTVPCLNIEGSAGRRKTAFASALAKAIDAEHVLYHDFTQSEEPVATATVQIDKDEDSKEEPPIGLFDRILSDACAFSEADKTVLIIDQLQAADFKEHIRIYRFLIEHEWRYRDAVFYANRKNLIVFLISEDTLYHSLQKHSFKLWLHSASQKDHGYTANDFMLEQDAEPLIDALNQLFSHINAFPTFSEYQKIIHDIQHNIHTSEDLRASIYGWTESIDRETLYSEQADEHFKDIMHVVEAFIGVTEEVELSSTPDSWS